MRVFVYESQTPVQGFSIHGLPNSIDNSNIYIVSDELPEEEVTGRIQIFLGTDEIFVIPKQLSNDRQFMSWFKRLFGYEEVAIEKADEEITTSVSEQAKQDAKLSQTGIIVTGELVKNIIPIPVIVPHDPIIETENQALVVQSAANGPKSGGGSERLLIPKKPTEPATGSNSVDDTKPDNTREVNPIMYKELQKFLDNITTDENNVVDAIFVTLTVGDEDEVFLVKSVNPQKPVNVLAYSRQISSFDELLRKLNPTSKGGSFQKAVFKFDQSSMTIARIGNKRQLNIFYVDTTGINAADVNLVVLQNQPKIVEQLRKLGKID